MLFDRQGRCLNTNRAGLSIMGCAETAVIGRQLSELFPDTRRESVDHAVETVLSGRQSVLDATLARPGASVVIWTATLSPIHDKVGAVSGFIGIFNDITAQRETERLLRESEARYRGLFENAHDMIQGVAPDGRFQFVNESWRRTMGYTNDELKDLTIFDIVCPVSLDHCMQTFSQVMSGERVDTIEAVFTAKDGRQVHVEGNANTHVVDGMPESCLGIFRDVTERKRTEEDSRVKALLLETASDAILMIDLDANFLYFNNALMRMTGYSREELFARRLPGIEPPEYAERIKPNIAMLKQRGEAVFESAYLRKDGTLLPIEVHAVISTVSGRPAVISAVRDITERKNAEAAHRVIEEQLRQSQKMEAVGRLAGGIAHDFNNILSAIIGYASIAQMKAPADGPLRSHLQEILAASERAAGLTEGLLMFSRKQVTELKPVNLNEAVGGSQKILCRLIGEDISLNVQFAPHQLVVNADRGQLEQVVMNLVTNARDALPRGGAITITTELEEVCDDCGVMKAGAFAVLTVSDTGVGINRETQEHIFEPFFTTKAVGDGTGLGLAIVYGIIEKHGGTIHLASEPGKGTTFRIYLPLLKTVLPRVAKAEPAMPPSGTETILLVEDDPAVRAATRAILMEYGYDVIEAIDGEDAVRVFSENQHRVQLVLSDLIMKNMNGREAFEEMKKVNPNIRSIFISGYTSDIILKKGILEEGINFVQKPLRSAELLEKIREVLGSARG